MLLSNIAVGVVQFLPGVPVVTEVTEVTELRTVYCTLCNNTWKPLQSQLIDVC